MPFAAPADEIVTLLTTATVGQGDPTQDWFITIGKMLDQPNSLIVVNETGGRPPNPRFAVDYPSIQVRVRSAKNGYQAAREKILDVKNALLGIPSQTVSSGRLTAINGIGDIQSMGVDDNDRPSFVMNFALIFEPTDAGYRE